MPWSLEGAPSFTFYKGAHSKLVHSSTNNQQLSALLAGSKQPLYLSGVHLCSDIFLTSGQWPAPARSLPLPHISHNKQTVPSAHLLPKIRLPAAAHETISSHHKWDVLQLSPSPAKGELTAEWKRKISCDSAASHYDTLEMKRGRHCS